ncbi:MAG: energy-coupling factor transporter ATPase [Treponemataceae bacterium]|nr:energy-coupling factor transporter ATPase [Treponemataceae bacterium]
MLKENNILEVKNVSYKYEKNNILAVNNVSFELESGKSIALLGANGSGKSTLVRIAAGFLECTEGSVERLDEVLAVADGPAVTDGIVFQSPKTQIIAGITAQDTALGLQNIGADKECSDLRIEKLLKTVHLWDKRSFSTLNLSLGQMQKLAFCGILALSPRLLFLDESVSMVDPDTRHEILDFIEEYKAAGNSVLCITHDIAEALRYDRILVMDKGSLIFDGTKTDFEAAEDLKKKLLGDGLPAKRTLTKNTDEDCSPALVFDGVDFAYSKESEPVLKNVSFALKRGTLTALVGESGAGKSTLFEIASGLLAPAKGSVHAKQRPAYCLQDSESALFEQFVADDVAYGPANQGGHGKALRRCVKEAMELAGLPYKDFSDRQVRMLSGGEKRMVSIAGIIAMNQDVMIFDEPCAALDYHARSQVMKTLQKLCDNGQTVLFSTHNMDEAACADRILQLKDSCIKEDPDSDSSEAAGSESGQKLEQVRPMENSGLLKSLSGIRASAYKEKDSPVHKLPPAAKILLFLAMFIPSFCIKNFAALGVCMVIAAVYSFFAKMPAKKPFMLFLKVIPWLLFFTLLQCILFPLLPTDTVIFKAGFFKLTQAMVENSIRAFCRLWIAVFALYTFMFSTPEDQLINGLRKLCPIKSVITVLLVLFRFIPLLADEAAVIIKVQLVRGGLGEQKGFFRRLKSLLPLFVPLFVRTLERAEDMGETLSARRF